MTDPRDPLAALWTATEAPARDLAFELAVEEAIARRRLALDAVTLAAIAAVAGLIAWLAGARLAVFAEALAAPFAQAGPLIVVSLVLAGLTVWWLQASPEPER
jgi:hypothetical protein